MKKFIAIVVFVIVLIFNLSITTKNNGRETSFDLKVLMTSAQTSSEQGTAECEALRSTISNYNNLALSYTGVGTTCLSGSDPTGNLRDLLDEYSYGYKTHESEIFSYINDAFYYASAAASSINPYYRTALFTTGVACYAKSVYYSSLAESAQESYAANCGNGGSTGGGGAGGTW